MGQSVEPGDGNAGGGDRRTAGVLALAGLAVLCLLLLADLRSLPQRLPNAMRTGYDYFSVLAAQPRTAVVDSVIGEALHDGVGTVRVLVVPSDLATSIVRPPDVLMAGTSQPALQASLIRRVTPGEVVPRAYDPRLDDASIAAWKAAGRISAYPKDVYLVRPTGRSDGVWVLCTDSGRMRVYLVPAAEAPAAAVTP